MGRLLLIVVAVCSCAKRVPRPVPDSDHLVELFNTARMQELAAATDGCATSPVESLENVRCLTVRADGYRLTGNFKAARESLRLADEIGSRVGAQSIEYAEAVGGLARLDKMEERNAEFEAGAHKAIRLLSEMTSPRAVSEFVALNAGLAQVRLHQGRFPEAERFARTGLEHAQKYEDPPGSDFGFAAEVLADILMELDRDGEAETLLKEAESVFRSLAANEGQHAVNQVLMSLGDVHYKESRFQEAAREYAEAVEIIEQKFGPDGAGLSRGLRGLGLCLQRLGDLEAAEAALVKAHGLDLRGDGPQSRSVRIAAYFVAKFYWDTRRFPDGRSWSAAALCEPDLCGHDAEDIYRLAATLEAQTGHFARSKELFKHTRALAVQLDGENSAHVARNKTDLEWVEALTRQQK
jgi:tetratricopeptide (TPR) repeat protein